ncbi:hypothetical protein H2203_002971 [Taxawa tesnikishii (nom. ined.)]|nr:hypothetical protein H2203_002971 [Dothideales sp. JES 119]
MASASEWTNIVRVDRARAAKDAAYARSFSTSGPCFCVYDERFAKDILGNSPKIKRIEQRDYQFAHEAGLYIKRTNSVYFTANFQTCDPVDLYAIDSGTHAIKKLDYPDVVQANGACNYQDKVLYCSQGDKSTPSSLVLVDPVTEKSEVLINNFQGREFNSINDVVIHHKTGDIWFTDPTYGYEQAFRPAPQLPCQVYRFRPSTHECWVVADGFEMCNGLCFDPQYKKLYVTDTGAIQAHNGPGDGHQFSFDPGNRRPYMFPDGIKCDANGYVYSGCGDGVHVWDPQGTLVGKIIVGNMTANFNFVKDGVWMFNEHVLYFVGLKAKGALVHIECE